MLSTSPITTWEGAAAFFNWAGSSGVVISFWVMVALCIIPLIVAHSAGKAAEKKAKR